MISSDQQLLRSPGRSTCPVGDYGFQLIQIPLRSPLGEWEYLALPFTDVDEWQQMVGARLSATHSGVEAAMRYNMEGGLLTFVAGFLVPQQNPMGRMLPRDDPRNLVFVVESLNRHLVTLVASHQERLLRRFRTDRLGLGKQFIEDDSITSSSHGSFLSDWDFTATATESSRQVQWAEPLPDPGRRVQTRRIVGAGCHEPDGTRVDQVKLVIVDLDDTLWRGIVAEEGDISDETIEGWPMGVIEALQFLKKRGVLLGIISKNDESKIEALWDTIMRGRLGLDDFVVRRINWKSKADNLEQILDEVNLLSRNVVFVDDNPLERAGIKQHLRYPCAGGTAIPSEAGSVVGARDPGAVCLPPSRRVGLKWCRAK